MHRTCSWSVSFLFSHRMMLLLLDSAFAQESFIAVGFPPPQKIIAGAQFTVNFRSAIASECRGVMPPLTVVFVRPIVYISPPVGFDKAGIVAESNVIGCSDGLYTAQVRVTIAAQYRQQVYLYVRLPTSESDQPKAVVGSPFDLDVEPAEVKWEKTGIICGRVQGHPWPDSCADGVGFDLAMAGVQIELMVQQCDEYSNPVTKCDSKSPPPELIQAVFKGEHKRKILSRATCDAACPHNPYNQSTKWCSTCPVFETRSVPVTLTASVTGTEPKNRL